MSPTSPEQNAAKITADEHEMERVGSSPIMMGTLGQTLLVRATGPESLRSNSAVEVSRSVTDQQGTGSQCWTRWGSVSTQVDSSCIAIWLITVLFWMGSASLSGLS